MTKSRDPESQIITLSLDGYKEPIGALGKLKNKNVILRSGKPNNSSKRHKNLDADNVDMLNLVLSLKSVTLKNNLKKPYIK